MERIPPKSVPSVLDAIGMTPVVQLRKLVPAGSADVFVKLEFFNPTGSYKDRMALAMIQEAVELHIEDMTREDLERVSIPVDSTPIVREINIRAPTVLNR